VAAQAAQRPGFIELPAIFVTLMTCAPYSYNGWRPAYDVSHTKYSGRTSDCRKKGSGYFIVGAIVLSERSAKIK
jgi:hypothetical protein